MFAKFASVKRDMDGNVNEEREKEEKERGLGT
jgi:hypothetical protein